MISLIVAHDKNRVIGYQNMLPWYLPGDLKHFKEQTLGKPVIMGRKTFESIGKPLKERKNIVITSNPDYKGFEGITLADSLLDAIMCVLQEPEIMIIGGAQIYEQALPLADRLYVTLIDHEFEGDAHFPAYENEWLLVSESEPISAGAYSFKYCIYERKKSL